MDQKVDYISLAASVYAIWDTWPIKDDVIKIEKNVAWMIRWMSLARPKDKTSAAQLKNTLQLNALR